MSVPGTITELSNVEKTGKIISRGAYGKVIEVCVHGMPCAAKEIHSLLFENVTINDFEFTKASFLNECSKSNRIVHPNIVQMLGIHYPAPGARLPWLIMELMDTSLRVFLESNRKGDIPLYIKLSILVDVAQGLEFLHGQDIVHRDLSSNNVLLTKHFVAKIADLGTAKLVQQSSMNTQMLAPGTLHFMPPEAISVKPRYGKPADVFSLACVILHVMSHQWPTPRDLLVQHYPVIALTEVQRREEFLQLCTPLPLQEMARLCLHNIPEERPLISVVCYGIKGLKANCDHQSAVATAYGFLSLNEKLNFFNEQEQE